MVARVLASKHSSAWKQVRMVHTPAIPAPGKRNQEDQKFKVGLTPAFLFFKIILCVLSETLGFKSFLN